MLHFLGFKYFWFLNFKITQMQPGNQSLSKCGMRLFTIKVTMMQKYLKIGSLSTFVESIKRILLRYKMILKFNACFCKYTLEPFKGRIIVILFNFYRETL